jgi:hypothetical protein
VLLAAETPDVVHIPSQQLEGGRLSGSKAPLTPAHHKAINASSLPRRFKATLTKEQDTVTPVSESERVRVTE